MLARPSEVSESVAHDGVSPHRRVLLSDWLLVQSSIPHQYDPYLVWPSHFAVEPTLGRVVFPVRAPSER
jgi:hypothetical protein